MGLECNNKFRSSPFLMKDFMEGTVWQDILQELQNWENRIMEELAAPTFDASTGQMIMGKSDRVLYDEMLRGCLKAIDNMRTIPSIIVEIQEQQLEPKQGQEPTHDEDDGDYFGFSE